jgi:hypothetical protein
MFLRIIDLTYIYMFLLVLIAIMSHYNKFILKHDQTKLRNDKIYFQNSIKSLGILAFNIIQDHMSLY